MGHNLYVKYHDLNLSASPDNLFTRFLKVTMQKSNKGHNFVMTSKTISNDQELIQSDPISCGKESKSTSFYFSCLFHILNFKIKYFITIDIICQNRM